jgi:hypothetical protein
MVWTAALTRLRVRHPDIPVTGDWNGNGVTKIGIFRNGLWYLDKER